MKYKLIFKAAAVLLAAMIFTGCGKSKENAANADGQAIGQTEDIASSESQQTEYEEFQGDSEEYDCYDCDGDSDCYPSDDEGVKTVSVSNVRQFIEALGSNRIIEMEPGIYNLSEFFDEGYAEGGISTICGVSYSGNLGFYGIKNLTIRGAGASGDKITEIVISQYDQFVFSFDECKDIVIENLKAGHTPSGYCSGGVFRFYDSERISINGAYMYGSGTEGLALANVSDMNVKNSRIYECTYHIMTVNAGRNISFEDCEFIDNKEFELVNVSETENISFEACEFRGNIGSQMFNVQGTKISVINSAFRGNAVDESIEGSDNVSFSDCVFEGVIPVSVSNAQQFLEALGSNRIIEMEPGIYNLSEFDMYLEKRNVDDWAARNEMVYVPKVRLSNGVEWSNEPHDGGELVLKGIKNLTIRGAGASGDKITEIVVEPRYAFVLNFDDCKDIVIENLKAGHTDSGECSGGVFRFNSSSRISINGAYMYGSGTEGLALTYVYDMNVKNSRIYECTYHIMTVSAGRNISFEDCEFIDNKEFSLVNVSETENMSFKYCEFRGNKGSQMFNVQGTEISVTNSAFSGNAVEKLIEHSDNVSFYGVQISKTQ